MAGVRLLNIVLKNLSSSFLYLKKTLGWVGGYVGLGLAFGYKRLAGSRVNVTET